MTTNLPTRGRNSHGQGLTPAVAAGAMAIVSNA
jgi:hypothetical protein